MNDYEAGYEKAYEWMLTQTKVLTYRSPENDFQAGWNQALADEQASRDDAAADARMFGDH